MPAINWTNQLSVGVHAIDTDHKLLVSLINQLNDAIEDGLGEETVGSVLNALCDYTLYHFGREEALMAACGYPDAEDHRKIHEQITTKVMDIRDGFLAGKDIVHGEDMLELMTNWLTDHIVGRDKLYQPFMDGKQDEIERANRAFVEKLSADADQE